MEDQCPICLETNKRSMAYLFRNQWNVNGLSVSKPLEDQWPIYLETIGQSMA